MDRRLSYASAVAAGWHFTVTYSWQCYAWKLLPNGAITRTALHPMGKDGDIGQQYRALLDEITRIERR